MSPTEGGAVGDDALFAQLYPGLRRFAAVVASAGTDADDLVQDALIRVLRRGGLGELQDPGAYLRRVILRLAVDDRRSFGRRVRALRRLAGSGSVTSSYPSDLSDLDRLDPVDRAVVYLGDVEGMQQSAIGELLGISHQAVRSRASRARRRLRADIEEEIR